MLVCFLGAGFVLFVFDSAPAALSQLLESSVRNVFRPQVQVSLLRGNVVDAAMVMLRVVPGKAPFEIGHGLEGVQAATGIGRSAVDGAAALGRREAQRWRVRAARASWGCCESQKPNGCVPEPQGVLEWPGRGVEK